MVDNFEIELRKLTGVIEDPFPKEIEGDWGTDLSLTNRLMIREGGGDTTSVAESDEVKCVGILLFEHFFEKADRVVFTQQIASF